MAYWLVKTEPDVFGWSEQVARGAKGEPWTGVRNHQAKNNLAAMAKGDQAFFYHTGDERRIVGVVEVVRAAYPDPSDPAWVVVDVAARSALAHPLSLADIKADPALADMVLIRNSRLSVQPVTAAQWRRILVLAGATEGRT